MSDLPRPSQSVPNSTGSDEAVRKVTFQCQHCGSEGWLLWSTPFGPPHGPVSTGLEALSDGFYMRMARTHRGDVEIICVGCGTAQVKILHRVR
jgi:hypothetical protein